MVVNLYDTIKNKKNLEENVNYKQKNLLKRNLELINLSFQIIKYSILY